MNEPSVTCGGPSGARLAAAGSHVAVAASLPVRDWCTARSSATVLSSATVRGAGCGGGLGGDGAGGPPAQPAGAAAGTAATESATARGLGRRWAAVLEVTGFTSLAPLFPGTPRCGGSGPRRRRPP